jgi:hypothetical protein
MGESSNEKRREVRSIGTLVSQLISRRGYAQTGANDQFQAAVAAVIGSELAGEIKIGKLNRGVLKIFARDSVTVQELTFQKPAILKKLQKELPESKITDLRFGVLGG